MNSEKEKLLEGKGGEWTGKENEKDREKDGGGSYINLLLRLMRF